MQRVSDCMLSWSYYVRYWSSCEHYYRLILMPHLFHGILSYHCQVLSRLPFTLLLLLPGAMCGVTFSYRERLMVTQHTILLNRMDVYCPHPSDNLEIRERVSGCKAGVCYRCSKTRRRRVMLRQRAACFINFYDSIHIDDQQHYDSRRHPPHAWIYLSKKCQTNPLFHTPNHAICCCFFCDVKKSIQRRLPPLQW